MQARTVTIVWVWSTNVSNIHIRLFFPLPVWSPPEFAVQWSVLTLRKHISWRKSRRPLAVWLKPISCFELASAHSSNAPVWTNPCPYHAVTAFTTNHQHSARGAEFINMFPAGYYSLAERGELCENNAGSTMWQLKLSIETSPGLLVFFLEVGPTYAVEREVYRITHVYELVAG